MFKFVYNIGPSLWLPKCKWCQKSLLWSHDTYLGDIHQNGNRRIDSHYNDIIFVMLSVIWAECRTCYVTVGFVMLNVLMLSDVLLSVVELNVLMLSVVVLNVVMLNVVMLSVIMQSVVMLSIVALSRIFVTSSHLPSLMFVSKTNKWSSFCCWVLQL